MASPLPAPGIRHSILDLAPLELDCLNALWPRGEATVREIQLALAPTRPRAYTTIMTILDRLAQKGVVQRRKTGRAWTYRPNVSEQDARSRAVAQLVNSFFDGSPEALAAHLLSKEAAVPSVPRTLTALSSSLQTLTALASASQLPGTLPPSASPAARMAPVVSVEAGVVTPAKPAAPPTGRRLAVVDAPEPEHKKTSSPRLETTLL